MNEICSQALIVSKAVNLIDNPFRGSQMISQAILAYGEKKHNGHFCVVSQEGGKRIMGVAEKRKV